MKISLITATFNSANTFLLTIESVRSQNFDNLEYIVIDGGSTDNTLEIINQNRDIITKLITVPAKGIYDALNVGLKNVSGDVAGFLHSDDYFADIDTLKIINNVFENRNVDFCYGDLQYIAKENPQKVLRHWRSSEFSTKALKRGWMPPHPSVYFNSKLIEEIGFFDTTYKISADYDWLIRCLIREDINVEYIPKVLIKMRTGGESNRNVKNIIKKSQEDYKIIRKNKIGNIFTLFCKNFSKLGQFF